MIDTDYPTTSTSERACAALRNLAGWIGAHHDVEILKAEYSSTRGSMILFRADDPEVDLPWRQVATSEASTRYEAEEDGIVFVRIVLKRVSA